MRYTRKNHGMIIDSNGAKGAFVGTWDAMLACLNFLSRHYFLVDELHAFLNAKLYK